MNTSLTTVTPRSRDALRANAPFSRFLLSMVEKEEEAFAAAEAFFQELEARRRTDAAALFAERRAALKRSERRAAKAPPGLVPRASMSLTGGVPLAATTFSHSASLTSSVGLERTPRMSGLSNTAAFAGVLGSTSSDPTTLGSGAASPRRDHERLVFAQYDSIIEHELKAQFAEALHQLEFVESVLIPEADEAILEGRSDAYRTAEQTLRDLAVRERELAEEEAQIDAATWEAETVASLLEAEAAILRTAIACKPQGQPIATPRSSEEDDAAGSDSLSGSSRATSPVLFSSSASMPVVGTSPPASPSAAAKGKNDGGGEGDDADADQGQQGSSNMPHLTALTLKVAPVYKSDAHHCLWTAATHLPSHNDVSRFLSDHLPKDLQHNKR